MVKFLDNLKLQFNQVIAKVRAMPQNRLIAYSCIILGIIFILLAIILW